MSGTKERSPTGSSDHDSIEQLVGESNELEPATDDESLDRERIFEVLSNERRRLVLHYLRGHEGDEPIQLRELVDQVAAWENETTVEELDSSDRKCVYTALKQSHLPKLDEFGIVEYDHLRGSVELTEAAADVQPYLEYVPDDDIPWSRYYLALSVVSAALAAAIAIGVTPFGASGGFALLALVVGSFLCSSVVHWHNSRQARLEQAVDVPRERN